MHSTPMPHVLIIAVALSMCIVGYSAAEEIAVGFAGRANEDGALDPWSLTTSSGEPQIKVVEENGVGTVLHVKSSKASFFLSNTSHVIDPAKFRTLRWTWKATTLPTGGDIRTSDEFFFSPKNKNDQAMQVILTFKNKKMLSYIWDTTAPAGTELKESNFRFNIQAIVVESGPDRLGQWLTYSRDFGDDYRRRHGGDPPPVIAVSVQSNCNHTASKAEGYFGPIRFSTADE